MFVCVLSEEGVRLHSAVLSVAGRVIKVCSSVRLSRAAVFLQPVLGMECYRHCSNVPTASRNLNTKGRECIKSVQGVMAVQQHLCACVTEISVRCWCGACVEHQASMWFTSCFQTCVCSAWPSQLRVYQYLPLQHAHGGCARQCVFYRGQEP